MLITMTMMLKQKVKEEGTWLHSDWNRPIFFPPALQCFNEFVQIGICICTNCKMYFSKTQIVHILPNFKRYLKKEKTRRDSDWNPPIFFPVQCNASMNLCKLENVFFQIKNWIFSNFKRYWKKEKTRLDSDWNPPIFFPVQCNASRNLCKLEYVFLRIAKLVFQKHKLYFSKLLKIFEKGKDSTRLWLESSYIFSLHCNASMNLCKLENVFLKIAKCICPNNKLYFSKLQNMFEKGK